MADLTPDDLSREIDRLWARVGSVPAEPSSAAGVPPTPPAAGVIGAEAAWETVALLKRQSRQNEASWRQTLEARDETLRALRASLETAEAELSSLRARAENEDERILVEALDARQKVATASKALALAEARHAEERRGLEETLQALRERMAAEISRARSSEQRWQNRESQYLIDLKELQAAAERREKEADSAAQAARAAENGLAEAKNALEKTLSELLMERKERERATAEREAALKNVEELRAHVDELSRIWEEERAQWKELWDRERASWESRRAELAKWEEDLRREREEWHADLQNKEKAHLTLTEDLAGKLRDTAKNADRVNELIDTMDRRVAEEGAVAVAAFRKAAALRARRWGVVAAAALFLVVAGRLGWVGAKRWRFSATATSPAATANPSALAFDGAYLWIADWSGSLVAVDPFDPRHVVRQAAPAPGGPYRPTAVAAGGGVLWTLDAAQARLLRHSAAAPEKILAARPSPGPAPTALAFDGESLWSYDAVDKAFTRHGAEDAPAKKYPLPDDAVPNSMAWSDGRLWVHDAKGHRLLVYALEGDRMVRVADAAMPGAGAVGFAPLPGATPRERVLHVLYGPSGDRAQPALTRYIIRRFLTFNHF